jgi:putative aldouronate transport system substrate-binding protein
MKKVHAILMCAAAVLLNTANLFAGGGSQQQSGGTPEISWYVVATQPQADSQTVLDKINEYIVPKVGATLKIYEDTGEYNQKMQMLIAAQEPVDLLYSFDTYNKIKQGAYLPLDDLLDKYGQDIKALLPVNHLESVRVNGKIYFITNQLSGVAVPTLFIERDVMEKYGFTRNDFKKYTDLEAIFTKMKADNPNGYPTINLGNITGSTADHILGIEPINYTVVAGVKISDTGMTTIFNKFETPEYKGFLDVMRSWFQKGYIRPDVLTYQTSPQDAVNGLQPIWFDWISGVNDAEENPARGNRMVEVIKLTDVYVYPGTFWSASTSISSTSRNPEKAMQFYNLFLTDPVLYNLVTRGIKDKHYREAGVIDGLMRIITIDDGGYKPAGGWPYGFSYHKLLDVGSAPPQQTIDFTKSAKPLPDMGFMFDTEPVMNEITAVTAVVNEYEKQLVYGAVDPAVVLPQFLARLKAAGSDRVVAEVQAQVDAWKKAVGK